MEAKGIMADESAGEEVISNGYCVVYDGEPAPVVCDAEPAPKKAKMGRPKANPSEMMKKGERMRKKLSRQTWPIPDS
jgi:endonuclease YncB( thermonuclease family)